MSADLYIHVVTKDFTEEYYMAFESNNLGSKYFNPDFDKEFEKKNNCDLYELCSVTPSVWVGEVSWLKAALFEDEESYIPEPVQKICSIIGEDFPVIDDDLIKKIQDAMDCSNQTSYSLTNAQKVIDFLNEHKGEKVFTISW